ncbi:MAG: cysteine synthase family protein [Rhodothermia bacterium]|nr:cysteine synthase family protein [Rhodothermia bacterium]
MTSIATGLRIVRPDQNRPAAAIRLPAVLESIGNTPLLELKRIGGDLKPGVRLFAKAEHLNPGGSVKDRPALRMVLDGISSGQFSPDQTLIDATSGNTGIAYAMIGAAMGFPVELALPENASQERKDLLRSFGAELIVTDPLEGTDGAQRVVREIVAAKPNRYFYPDQYNNPGNWRAHFDGTGQEILDQTNGLVTHFVCALGTTGTFTGVTRRLKHEDQTITCIAVQPDSPIHAMEGVKHLDTAVRPGIFSPDLPDETVEIDSDASVAMARRLAREEGLLVGVSAGANVLAAYKVALQLESGTVVTILCDTGARYLSDSLSCRHDNRLPELKSASE